MSRPGRRTKKNSEFQAGKYCDPSCLAWESSGDYCHVTGTIHCQTTGMLLLFLFLFLLLFLLLLLLSNTSTCTVPRRLAVKTRAGAAQGGL